MQGCWLCSNFKLPCARGSGMYWKAHIEKVCLGSSSQVRSQLLSSLDESSELALSSRIISTGRKPIFCHVCPANLQTQ
eukprot:742315-Amphidinium_carterae.1